VVFESNNDTSNNTNNWNYLKIIHKIHTSNTPGKHDIKELQKTAILETGHILRNVLMSKYTTCIMENGITFITYFIHTAKMYTIETWFVSDM
jgi:hypothetical protein